MDEDYNGIPDECEGACCNDATGQCADHIIVQECTGRWTALTTCDVLVPACTPSIGACCDQNAGTCADDVPFDSCRGLLQNWTAGIQCNEALCQPVIGACCNSIVGCTDNVISAECSCPECSWYGLASCCEIECHRAVIPTVSAWGLAALTLGLLTAAKLRRINSTAS